MRTFRRNGIYLRRVWWWAPWGVTKWWVPKVWKGGDEWCNVPLCFTVPPFGCLLVFWRRMRTMPCDECWGVMKGLTKIDYLPGGYLEGGEIHSDRVPAWKVAKDASR